MALATAVNFGSGVAARIVPVEVAAGGDHTCARLSDGRVFCWGNNTGFEVGQSSGAIYSSPQQVGFGTGVVARSLASGFSSSCAVLGDGTVRCWGGNSSGQLGDGSTNGSPTPVQVTTSSAAALTDVVAVSVGDFHACGITVTGAVYCWGAQPGNGSSSNSSRAAAVPLAGPAIEIAAGGSHTCALMAGGAVQCWGTGGDGQLGNGSMSDSTTPVTVSLSTLRATHIGSGVFHSCAVLDNGVVRCWGRGTSGQLGNNGNVSFSMPTTVFSDSGSTLLSGVVGVAGGLSFTCAVRDSLGGVSCWGAGGSGQLGDGTTTSESHAVTSFPPDYYMGTAPFGQYVFSSVHGGAVLASGDNHSCALMEVYYSVGTPFTAREVRCWGNNDSGQLGDGTTTNRKTMTAVLGGTEGAVAVAAGARHSCLLTFAGSVSCWGLNSSGQLGDGTLINRTSPVSVSLPMPAIAITAGDAHTCALLSDSTVRCWGRNRWDDYSPPRYGTIGCNSNSFSMPIFSPTAVKDGVTMGIPDLSGVRAIAAGGRHTCALMAAGTVRCWGINDHGQVHGSGESTDSIAADASVFQVGSPAITAIAITAGADYSCAVKANGQVTCWGDDALGQLGNGSPITNFNAVQTDTSATLTDVVSVYGGSRTTCALRANSNVWCWGTNGFKQAGAFSTANQPQAHQVGGPASEGGALEGIFAVSSGATMSCGFRANGSVLCWGGNANGELAISNLATITEVPQFCTFPLM